MDYASAGWCGAYDYSDVEEEYNTPSFGQIYIIRKRNRNRLKCMSTYPSSIEGSTPFIMEDLWVCFGVTVGFLRGD